MKVKYLITAMLLGFLINANSQQNAPPVMPPEAKDIKVFTFVEQQPEFPGGIPALLKFLGTHIKYPRKERNKGIQGKVLIQFVVDETGKVTDATIVKSVSPGIDKEALRVVKMLPDFKPGRFVRVYYNLPIDFKFQ